MSIDPAETSEIQELARSVPEAVQPLANSNDIPTQHQLNIVLAWKESVRAALADLPDADNRRMQRRSVAVTAHQRLCQSVRSAARRLPAEVLQVIFLKLVRDLGSKLGYDVFNANAGPWPLIHVSRLWRSAALGCTELWAAMMVGSIDITSKRWKHALQLRDPVALLTAALAYSGQRDLYIKFIDRSENASMFFRVLVEHCNRWREALLDLCPDDTSLLRDIGSRVPRLRLLTYRPNDCLEFPGTAPPLALRKAPNLVELRLIGRPIGVHRGILSKVVKLSYCVAEYEDMWRLEYDPLDVLSLCPNAEDVSLDPGAPFTEFEWEAPLLVDVTDLIRRDRITRFWTSDVRLLDHLCLPSLSDLSLRLTANAIVWEFRSKPTLISPAHLPTLLAFLKRSRCPLTKLILDGANLRSRQASLSKIFTLTPGLLKLEVYYGCHAFMFSQDELRAIHEGIAVLVESLSNTELLPNLGRFVFASFAPGEPAFTFADANFFAMCRMRRPTLHRAYLYCTGCPHKGFPTLKRDIDDVSGVRVSVHGKASGIHSFLAMLRGESNEKCSSGSVDE
ncbi:hypothetical protein CPB85DRAFT_1560729 [Mucidula mucida]|nr:hypothetical protein CPB85DRAFT_1560729 [Mucidula mucida]